jgi:putative endonuclease
VASQTDREPVTASGADGETEACRYLEGLGFRVLARNFRTRFGEIDVVAREGDVLVFVEVKARRGGRHGEGVEAITREKRRRIVGAARLYAAARNASESPIRFDVVSVDVDAGGRVHVRHERGAFDSDGR